MGCLTVIMFILSFGVSILVDVMGYVIAAANGFPIWIAIVGIILDNIAFILGYALSAEITFAPRDFWRLSSFDVLKKKIAVAESAKAVVWALWFVPALVL